MITHYIILGSSYSLGKRIALDYPEISSEYFKGIIEEIFNKCGEDVSISWHYLTTDSKQWTTVAEKDAFFKGVQKIESIERFIKLLKKDRILNGVDIAKYILSKISCTHLKLQKLTYLCYADYLCETGKKLFNDKIYAFKYGPVVDSVYERCKGIGDLSMDEDIFIDSSNIFELPSKSRILVAENGYEKCVSIDNTLSKYGKLSAGELVDITHKPHSPWANTDSSKMYEEISDDIILEFHKNEII